MLQAFEKALIKQCAPTLAGLKTGNLFRYAGEATAEQLALMVRHVAVQLAPRGIAIAPLRQCTQASLFLVYRPSLLARDLTLPGVEAFLREAGYPTPLSAPKAVATLQARLNASGEFPHEIGLFLGYPLEDVCGFIANKGRNYCLCGYWKVYGDPEDAAKRFAGYKKCTNVYNRQYQCGQSLAKLAVAK